MKILLTGDWQAKFANLDYCERAHKQELDNIAKHKVDVHIDLGDQKDEYNHYDGRVTEFAMRRARAISKNTRFAIRLLGNHDRFGQHSDSNNWFSIFQGIAGASVTRPKAITFEDVTFSCLPFRKTSLETNKGASDLAKNLRVDRKNILIFHNDVYAATYNRVQSRQSTSKITLQSMHTKKYTRCFGGHIHLAQALSKNTEYVGNPFATDMGEVNQQKGFVLYDTDTNKVTRIPSTVPGIFTWDYVQKHKLKSLPDGTKIKAVVDCDSSKNYHTQLDAVSNDIEKRYPMAISFVLPRFKDASAKEEVVVDPLSSDYDKIKSYIAATVPDHLASKKKQLAAYMASVLHTASGKALSRFSGRLLFGRIRAENVLSFKELDYNFRKQGVVLVQGKNLDWPSHSNGSGKSNFLSIVPIVISAQTFKGQKNDAWASDRNARKAKASLTMTDERGRKLKVVRQRRPGKLRMFINGKDQSTGLRSNGKKETQGQIEEFTGLNFSTLANSVYIDQRISNAFLTGTPKDRADLIHAFQNLERFVRARTDVTKELSFVKRNSELFDSSIAISQRLIADVEAEEAASQKTYTGNISKLKDVVVSAKKHAKKIAAATAPRRKVLQKLYDKLSSKEDKIESRVSKLDKEVGLYASRVADKMSELSALLLSKDQNCNVCFQPLTKEALQNAKRCLSKQIKTEEDALKHAEESRVKYKLKGRELRKRIHNLDSKMTALSANLDKAQRALEDAELSLQSANEVIASTSKIKEASNEKRHAIKRAISQAHKALENYAKDEEFLEYVIKAFSRDGLPSFLSNLLIPQLNKAAARYSSIFIDSEIQVVFEVDRGQITPRIINAHGGKTLQAQSMGESAWAGLITSFALREIAQPSNLLILDEPGNGLDPESAKKFGSRLHRLKKHFETILIVSHNQQIIAALQNEKTLTVVKKNKVSSLVHA